MSFASHRRRLLLGMAGLLLTTALGSGAAARTFTERVRFARGRSSATIKNAVVRGDRDRYLVGAKARQRITVRIRSFENNAVFQIQGPNGRFLRGAEEGQDATRWSGKLPAGGNYAIVVGGTRGNATYTLDIAVR